MEENRNTCLLVVALWPVGCLVRTGTGAGTAVQVLAAEYGHFNNYNNSRNNDNDKNAMAAQIQVHSMT